MLTLKQPQQVLKKMLTLKQPQLVLKKMLTLKRMLILKRILVLRKQLQVLKRILVPKRLLKEQLPSNLTQRVATMSILILTSKSMLPQKTALKKMNLQKNYFLEQEVITMRIKQVRVELMEKAEMEPTLQVEMDKLEWMALEVVKVDKQVEVDQVLE